MCLLTLPLAGDLAPTKTYAVRRWAWVRNADPAALADGTLTITLRRSAKPGVKSEDDSYDVAEQPEAVGGWRRFYLVNATDPRQKDVYEVVLGPRGDTCTCPAGAAGVPNCKHRDAIKSVAAAGGFDRPEVGDDFAPAADCLICGEALAAEDAAVHPACELTADELALFDGPPAWASVPF